jgi:hypothetical protein
LPPGGGYFSFEGLPFLAGNGLPLVFSMSAQSFSIHTWPGDWLALRCDQQPAAIRKL